MYWFPTPRELLEGLLEADAQVCDRDALRIGRSYPLDTTEDPIASGAKPGEKAGNPLLDDYARKPLDGESRAGDEKEPAGFTRDP